MTDIKCSKCYGEIDSRAKVCPHCGKRLKRTGQYYLSSILGGLGLMVILIGIFISPTGAVIIGGLLLLGAALVKRSE